MEIDDRQVVEQVLAGDVDIYSFIVDRYQQIVANLAYKLCGRSADIEDVTQQVFVELYDALPRFRFDSKLSSFIYRITVNTSCKWIARNKRFVWADSNDSQNQVSATERNAEQQVIHEEQLILLRQAIGRLKEEQRTALVLYNFEGFSYNQIAETLQCSLSKVESLIFRAKKSLEKMLR